MKKKLITLILFFCYISIFSINNIYAESEYKLTLNDNNLIENFCLQIKDIIQEKGILYKDRLTYRIDNILENYTLTNRIEKILEEINNKIKNIEVHSEELIDNNSENYLSEFNIDLNKVKSTWIGWYNKERNSLGKYNYEYNNLLEKTAIEWSNFSKEKGEISHKRNNNDSYYDYNKITSWFGERGVVCKNIYKITHTENIGHGSFYCNDGECTDEFITGIENTFNFYMGEKNDDYKPHYNSIMNDYFTIMGVGFAIEKKNNYYEYYLTVHYCTELINTIK